MDLYCPSRHVSLYYRRSDLNLEFVVFSLEQVLCDGLELSWWCHMMEKVLIDEVWHVAFCTDARLIFIALRFCSAWLSPSEPGRGVRGTRNRRLITEIERTCPPKRVMSFEPEDICDIWLVSCLKFTVCCIFDLHNIEMEISVRMSFGVISTMKVIVCDQGYRFRG
jgi:hypothetical protein